MGGLSKDGLAVKGDSLVL